MNSPDSLFPLDALPAGRASFAASALACEEPSARLDSFGPAALSDVELLAVLLGGPAGKSVEAAREMLASAGSLSGVARWLVNESSGAAVKRVAVSFEIARRMLAEENTAAECLNRPELIAAFMRSAVYGLEVEKFWVLCLNRKNRLIRRVELTSGTATSSLAHPREVFRAAVKHGASAIVCVHNHPSGDPATEGSGARAGHRFTGSRYLREGGQ